MHPTIAAYPLLAALSFAWGMVDQSYADNGTLAAPAAAVRGPSSGSPDDLDFQQQVIDAAGVAYERAVGDLDRDGHNDIIAVPHAPQGELWLYRAPDFQRQVLLTLDAGIHGYPYFRGDDLQLADFDLDGDLDVAVRIGDAGDANGMVVWIENPLAGCNDLAGTWIVHPIGANGYVKDIVTADIDRDGRPDIVTREDNVTQLWFNDGPEAWVRRDIAHPAHEGMDVGDLDGDGDLDLVLNGFWLETPADPRQHTYVQHSIDAIWYNQSVGWQGNSCKVSVADVDGNGANDVVLSHSEYTGYPVAWYSAADPMNGPWTQHVIVGVCDDCHNLQARDFNNDGHIDVLFGGMPQSSLAGLTLMIGDGGASWTPLEIESTGSYSAELGDLEDDGDLDIITIRNWDSAPTEIWRNTLNTPMPALGLNEWTYIQVDDSRTRWGGGYAYFGLGCGDLNGDGLLDIVSGNYYYPNPGGDMTSAPWPRVTFDIGANIDASLVVDVDGDAFGDVIASTGPQIYWLEADNVAATSWTAHLVDAAAPYNPEHNIPQGYATADIVPGDRPEILFNNGNTVYYYQIPPVNPEAGAWPRTQVGAASNSEDLAIGDIDRDGLLDVAMAHWTGSGAKSMKWARNPGDGSGNWTTTIVGEVVPDGVSRYPDRVKVADLNGDGRNDIVCTEETSQDGASTYWFEAPVDPAQTPWTRHTIATQYTTNSMDVADIDHDGDVDVITQEHRGTERLQIWANDGCGVFTEHVVDSGVEGHLGARVADLDQDGDLEIFSIAFDDFAKLHLWRNDNGPGANPDDTAPVAAIHVDTSLPGPAPATVVFDGSASCDANGAITTYDWAFSDGASADGAVAAHTFTANGVHSATLTVTNAQGLSDATTQAVYIGSPDAGLIGSWPFDEQAGAVAYDLSGRTNDLTLQAGANWGAGIRGGALVLDGADDHASRPDAQLDGAFPAKSDGSGVDCTFAAWIRLAATGVRQPIIQKQGDEQRGINFCVESDNRLTCELFRDQGAKTELAAPTPLSAGVWHHVALTYDFVADGASVIRLYVDGVRAARHSAAVGPIVPNTVDLNVGKYYWSSSYAVFFDGRLDEVRSYDRALSGPEVAALAAPPPSGDYNRNHMVDLADAPALAECLRGPDKSAWEDCRRTFDFDGSGTVDLRDVARFQQRFGAGVP